MVNSSASNLFIAFTPYNIFLACGVALSEGRSRDNDLVICADFEAAPLLVSVLNEWSDSPFRSIILLPGARDSQPLPWRVGTVSLNSLRIKHRARSQAYQTVYVFNERRAESQSAMHWVKQTLKHAKVVVIEDGLNAYRNRPFAFNGHPLACRLRRMLYGRWTEDVVACGTTRWVEQVLLMYPQLVNEHVASQLVGKLPRESLLSPAMTSLAELVLKRSLGCDAQQIGQFDGLFLLSHSGVYRRESTYRLLVQRVIAEIATHGNRIAVKYHPREHAQDPFGIESHDCVASLPRGLSSEFLLLHPQANFRFMLGDMTSALMSARWLKPKIQAVCLAPVLEHAEQGLYQKLATLGVQLVDRSESVPEFLHNLVSRQQVPVAA